MHILLWLFTFGLTHAATNPTIIYFGGYRATQAQMEQWEAGYQHSSVGSKYNFVGVPYPAVTANTADVLKAGAKVVAYYASYIKAHPDDEFILAGHSSGGVLPTAVAKLLPTTAKVKLFIFDGANQAASMQNVFPTTCYSGINPMAGCHNWIKFKAPTCLPSGRWCLHFGMINANASATLNSIDHGYDNFVPYLDWLN